MAHALKEYKDRVTYKQNHPHGICDGSDGNWLTKDRQNKSKVWDKANHRNLQSSDGYKAYRTLIERAAFYDWFDQETKKQGFTTQWAKLAGNTTKRLNFLTSTSAKLLGYSNREIDKFIIDGNELIFNDCWPELVKLIRMPPLTGERAKEWDGKILKHEQMLIHPSYLKLKKSSLLKLERLLRKESLLTQFLPGYEFEGSILSINDVYMYGMKRMGYAH